MSPTQVQRFQALRQGRVYFKGHGLKATLWNAVSV